MAAVLLTTITYGTGIEIEIYGEEVEGGVKLSVVSTGTDQNYDINGLFLDTGASGGALTYVGDRSNNMNGSDSADGTKFDGWDYAQALGSVGGNDTNWTSGSTFFSGLTLADLDGAEIGLRITSASVPGGGLKLSEIAHVPEDEPDHFPVWGSPDISHVTLYWRATETLDDSKPKPEGDGWFTVKFDYDFSDPEFSAYYTNDLDDNLDGLLDFLVERGLIQDSDKANLVGVAIKGGRSGEVWYDLDDDPLDQDSATDDIPDYPIENKELDVAYTWQATTDTWVLS
ncbi:hypothetical protein [Microvirga massiliensis]|uniref:hypothetical protein n=1 Tax=Microvirga massiliensis TaxID=1033741 RepID=UPI00062BD00C|nr:hypothetical protein [Microvirga massiliensis]